MSSQSQVLAVTDLLLDLLRRGFLLQLIVFLWQTSQIGEEEEEVRCPANEDHWIKGHSPGNMQ